MSAASAERIRTLVQEQGLVQALNELFKEAWQSDSVQAVVEKFETFHRDQLEPFVAQNLPQDVADKLNKELEGFFAKLRAEKRQEKKLSKRISKKITGLFNSGSNSAVAAATKETEDEKQLEEEEEEEEENPENGDQDDEQDNDDEQEEEDNDDEENEEMVKRAAQSENLQPAARLQTGYEGNLTSRQAQDLEKFREMMYATEYKEDILRNRDGPDRLLLRFLRAECNKKRVFNLQKSKKRLLATLQWRRENNIDDMIDNPPEEYKKFLGLNGEMETISNVDGRVWVWTRASYLASYMDIHAFDNDTWLKCVACLSEHRMQTLRESSEKFGHEISAIVMVYDLRGPLGLSARRVVPFVRLVNSVAAAHYPELVDNIYTLASPRIFSMLYGLVSPFLDPVTREKVSILTNSKKDNRKFFDIVKKNFDLEKIPIEYGGTSKTVTMPMPTAAIQKGVKLPPPFPV